MANEEEKEGDKPTNTDGAEPKDGEREDILVVDDHNLLLHDESQPQSSQHLKKDTPSKSSSARKGITRDTAKKASINAGSAKSPSTPKLSADANGKERLSSSQ